MFESEKLKGRVIWLTGASGGLGGGIARHLARAGVQLALHGWKNTKPLQALRAELEGEGVATVATSGDLSQAGTALRSMERISSVLGPVYSLVHATGPFTHKRIAEHSSSEFREVLHGNLTSFFETAKAALPAMRKNGDGRIIALAMAGADRTNPMRSAGPALAAKSGLVALCRTLALEEAGNGITVNVIQPGKIERKTFTREQARRIDVEKSFPMGHPGSFEDIADAILFFLSPAAVNITGAVLDVSAGWMGDDWKLSGGSNTAKA